MSAPKIPGDRVTIDDCKIRPGFTRTIIDTRDRVLVDGASDMHAFNTRLVEQGLWRGAVGERFYRVACDPCNSCVPIRIDTRIPQPDADALDALNNDLVITIKPAEPDDDHLKLYYHYHQARHGFNWLIPSPHNTHAAFGHMLKTGTGFQSLCMEARSRQTGKLVAANIFDPMDNGVAGRFFYYDLKRMDTQTGKWMIGKLIEWAQGQGLSHLYLGNVTRHPSRLRWKWSLQGAEIMTHQGVWTPVRRARDRTRPDTHLQAVLPAPDESL